MSFPDSTNLSGSGNPYTQIISPDFLINADKLEVKRTKAHPTRAPFARWLAMILVSETRFFEGTPCWEWQGCKSGGYGQFKFDGRRGGKRSSPHRFSWEFFYDAIPEGYEVDHRCRNRGCASPFHLEAVTLEVNRKRRGEAVTHCTNQHEYTKENTQITPSGSRKCRQCNRDKQKAFHAANPSAQKRYRT